MTAAASSGSGRRMLTLAAVFSNSNRSGLDLGEVTNSAPAIVQGAGQPFHPPHD
jgi:hypothetical protein